jgi:hypothetical protein
MATVSSPGVTFHPFKDGENLAALLDRAGQTSFSNLAVFDCANFKEVLLDGWSAIEEGYVWSCQSEAAFAIKVSEIERQYRIRLIADTFKSTDELPSQRAMVFFNERPLGEVTIGALGVIDCHLPALHGSGEAVIRFKLPDARRPSEFDPNNSDDRLLGLSLHRIVVSQVDEASQGDRTGSAHPAGEPFRTDGTQLSDGAKAELLTRFESLGENCEFGLVQRRCGAEPLGLLRFSSAPLPKLLRALQSRFAGMGSPENIGVELSSNELEYMVRDRAFGFYYHAWVKAGEMTPEQIHAREKSRVPFLLRKLIEDLTDGEKVFVFHAMEEISTASAHVLADAIKSYGPGKLFWVRLADRLHPPGFTEVLGDNLIAGYIDRFAPGDNAYDLSLDCWVDLCRSVLRNDTSNNHRAPSAMAPNPVRFVPPYALMQKWLGAWTVPGTTRVRAPYDDVLDVLRAMLVIVPVNEEWYLAEYPAVARPVVRTRGETAAIHFRKHGYFEGRQPFADGWCDLRQPVPFLELAKSFRTVVARGGLLADFDRDDFLDAIKKILRLVRVDDEWYRKTYPVAAEDIKFGRSPSAAEHYVTTGYFQGLLPADIDVDADWYMARYAHVRTGLAEGVAHSAKDHFLRIGYGEGCQPTP